MEKKVKFSPLINFLICNLQVMSCTVVEEESFDEFEAIEVELGINGRIKKHAIRLFEYEFCRTNMLHEDIETQK